MKISVLESSPDHIIRFYLFIDNFGYTVTSFFQAVKMPDVSLGAYNTLQEAREAVKKQIHQSSAKKRREFA